MITSASTPDLKTILITGAQGQLGLALIQHFDELARQVGANLKVHSLDRSQLDLGQPDSIRRVMRRLRPDIVINAAAYTAVDQAELEPTLAHAINARGPEVLAEEAKALDATLIHYSTDYVFNGQGSQAYLETDACAPKSVYGASKLAGEKAIESTGAKHIIFRTSWVYAAHGSNFMLTMLKLAQDRETLSVIDDQWGAPTWVGRIVDVTERVVMSALEARSPQLNGIYHLCPQGETTWYRYAAKTFELLPRPTRKMRTLLPISSAQYESSLQATNPTRVVAQRPANSRLNCGKLELALGLTLPSWEEDLKLCLSEGKF
jgi:dTDP-4-dehydrorhamnose reductase